MLELSEKDKESLERMLQEKIQYAIERNRNLFNFEVIDDIKFRLESDLKNGNLVRLNEYESMFQVIDSFDDLVDKYIIELEREYGDK